MDPSPHPDTLLTGTGAQTYRSERSTKVLSQYHHQVCLPQTPPRPSTHNYSLDLSDPFKRRPDNNCARSSSRSTCSHGAHDQSFLTCSYQCEQDYEPRSSCRCRPMSKARRKVILTFSPTAVFSTIPPPSIQSPIAPDPPRSPPLRDADLSCVRIC